MFQPTVRRSRTAQMIVCVRWLLTVASGLILLSPSCWAQRRLPPVATPDVAVRAAGRQPTASDVEAIPAPQADRPLLTAAAADEEKTTELPKPWWATSVERPMWPHEQQPLNVRLENLLYGALEHSAQLQVIREVPLIRETGVIEADSQFDWVSFVETQWRDISEPVGSTLTTGGPSRFRDHHFTNSLGMRRRNTLGGQFEASQQFGYQDTNSLFFIPGDQGTARMTLGYTQPLLRGAGRVYNTSLTILAQIDSALAQDEVSRQLQSHLVDVARAYWDLYRERAVLLQKQKLYDRAAEILQELQRREQIDAVQSQLVRARAAVESRRADIVRAEMAVENVESRLRALVNDSALGTSTTTELIPLDPPSQQELPVDINNSVELAMQHRPEIAQAIKQIQSAGVRLRMSENELLPALNVVLQTYVSGLRGNSGVGDAFVDQFREGEPSYSVGLQYEVPVWNRRAKSQHRRRRHELRQVESQLRATMEMLRLDVEVAVREVLTTYREMNAEYGAMTAAQAEVDYIRDRWQVLAGTDQSASLLLEDLLDAQERLGAAEFAFLTAQTSYNFAQIAYQRALGTLLETRRISVERFCEAYLPSFEFRGSPTHAGPQEGTAVGK